MKAEIDKDGKMVFICENPEDVEAIKAWVILNNGKTLIPERRTDYAITKLENVEVIICTNSK